MTVAALPFLLAGSAVASSAAGAFGQIQAGNAAARAQDVNAEVEARQGQVALSQAAGRSEQVNRENERALGSVRAAFGAAGVDPNQGTPLAVMSDVATQAEMRRQLTIHQGRLAFAGAASQAAITRAEGQAAKYASRINAAGTILTGATNAAKNLYIPASGGTGG